MTKLMHGLQLALRERRKWIVLFCIWALVTVICGAVGPFGTFDVLNFPARLGYWALLVGVSVIGSQLPLTLENQSVTLHIVVWVGFILGLSALILGVNAALFADWWSLRKFLQMLVYVTLIVFAVHVFFWLIHFARPVSQTPDVDPQIRFLRRVPISVRGPLVRIEAQDHYLNVITTKGAALILMRMSEAVDELQGTEGIVVHRSHWIAVPQVQAHKREKSRDLLTMSDGTDVPVSRSNRAVVKEAGLI